MGITKEIVAGRRALGKAIGVQSSLRLKQRFYSGSTMGENGKVKNK